MPSIMHCEEITQLSDISIEYTHHSCHLRLAQAIVHAGNGSEKFHHFRNGDNPNRMQIVNVLF